MKRYTKDIEDCCDCPSHEYNRCHAITDGNGVPRYLTDIFSIPDWCPLPDAPPHGAHGSLEGNQWTS